MKRPVGLEELFAVIQKRMTADPKQSYVAQLIHGGEDAILKKVGEECCELLLAAKNPPRGPKVHELADLWFHLLVWMADQGITPAELKEELGTRFGRSGLTAHEN